MKKVVFLTLVMALGIASAQIAEQAMPAGFSSLSGIKSIEIRDASGQPLLRGSFTPEDADKNESELEASLAAVAAGSAAKGKAEIEIEKEGATEESELELELKDLPASSSLKVFLDDKEFATINANGKGEAQLKFTSKKKSQ